MSAKREPLRESGARTSSQYFCAKNSSLGLSRKFQHRVSAKREPPRESGALTSSQYVRANNSIFGLKRGFHHGASAQREPPRESEARTSTHYVRAKNFCLGLKYEISAPCERAARAAEGERSSGEFAVRSVEKGVALNKADRACHYLTSEATIQQGG